MKISGDDLVLALQRAIDRLIRRLRRGGPPIPTQRRLLIVQIDSLSRVALEQGLASGRMPPWRAAVSWRVAGFRSADGLKNSVTPLALDRQQWRDRSEVWLRSCWSD
jgi:hypothetical protein